MKYDIWINANQYDEVRRWCVENFGVDHNRAIWTMLANNELGGQVLFTNEEDAMAAKLRWS